MARGKTDEFNQIKYQNDFKRDKYDSINLIMPKGRKSEVKNAAKAAGQSMSEYINRAIEAWMHSEV